jgi:hypothetical protein
MKLNRLIENQYDPNSCYLKCDCGCGIVEFNYYIGEDREYYSLDFYGYIKHSRNYKHSYFEFSDKDEVFKFIDSLVNDNVKYDLFFDREFQENSSYLEIDKSDPYISIQKKRKGGLIWDICVLDNRVEEFTNLIKEIIK